MMNERDGFICWRCGLRENGDWKWAATIHPKYEPRDAYTYVPLCEKCADPLGNGHFIGRIRTEDGPEGE